MPNLHVNKLVMLSPIYRCKIKSIFFDVQQLFKELLKVLPKNTPLTPGTTLWEVANNMNKNYLGYLKTLTQMELKIEYQNIFQLRTELADYKKNMGI